VGRKQHDHGGKCNTLHGSPSGRDHAGVFLYLL
jgi:hypothetical protein